MDKIKQKVKRAERIRSKIRGTSKRPRLSVFRSNRFIYAQLIDDEKGQTILGIKRPLEASRYLGVVLAKAAQDKNIKEVVFDKGSYLYQGKVKALAEGAREGGLKF